MVRLYAHMVGGVKLHTDKKDHNTFVHTESLCKGVMINSFNETMLTNHVLIIQYSDQNYVITECQSHCTTLMELSLTIL